MTPNIRSQIPAYFPDDDAPSILNTLLSTGRGLSHARSCVTYSRLLHCCQRNRPFLERMVQFANANPIQFDNYISRYARWQFLIGSMENDDLLAFFSPILQRFAIEASQFEFAWLASHFTICTSPNDAHAEPNDLFFVPIIDSGVFITSDANAPLLMNTAEIAKHCSGKLSVADDAASDMIESLKSYYEMDAVAPIVR